MLSLFDNFVNYPYGTERPNVYVVSDSTYKECQQKQAQAQINYLEQQLDRYERLAEATRANIVEVQTTAGLLPEAKEADTPTE